jgi:hypothetical protein
MEEFCLGIFANADKSDRESPTQPPEVSLAGRFYISSLFFDVLTQFYEGWVLPPDLEEKRRYARYRTLQIRNRQPIDPQPGADTPSPGKVAPATTEKVKDTKDTGFKYAEPEDSPKKGTQTSKAVRSAKPIPISAPIIATNESSGDESSPVSGRISRGDAMSAKKKLLQAISAIDFVDYSSATSLIQEALKLLGTR